LCKIGIINAGCIGIISNNSRQAQPTPRPLYNIANPTRPTAPKIHDAAFACAAPLWLAVGEAAEPLPLALPLSVLVPLVPLGLPEIPSCVTETPVPFLQFEL
jgi:hypothetical protein